MLFDWFSTKTAYISISKSAFFLKISGEEEIISGKVETNNWEPLLKILKEKKIKKVYLSLNKNFYFSDIINIGHIDSVTDLDELILWRFSKKWDLLARDYETVYLELFQKEKEKFYFVVGMERKILDILEKSLQAQGIEIEEIMVPSYIIASAILKKQGTKNFFFVFLGNDDISFGLVSDGKIVFLQELKNFAVKEASLYEVGLDLYFGLLSYLTDKYAQTFKIDTFYIGIEGWEKGKFEVGITRTAFLDEIFGNNILLSALEEIGN